MMKSYLLDSAKALTFFKENLFQMNELSKAVLEVLQLKPGAFYAFLPQDVPYGKIHDFNTGGKTLCLREEVSAKLTTMINSNSLLSCIFDDFNSSIDQVDQNELYNSHGIHYQGEIYYKINSGSKQEVVLKCLNYSSTIWHSLCVVFKFDSICGKEIDRAYIEMVCRNAVFIMIEAYDAESYIYWCDSEGAKALKNI